MLLGYLFKNKVLLILIIIIVGVLFLNIKINSNKSANVEIPSYQVSAPSYELASKVGATSSRIYFIRDFKETDTSVTLLVWYDYDQKEWQKHTTPLPFDKDDIKIYDRRH